MTAAESVAEAPRPRVSFLALLRVFWRSLFLQAAWNPHGMQNLGFAFAMQPALRELYPDAAARARAAGPKFGWAGAGGRVDTVRPILRRWAMPTLRYASK